MLTRLKAFENTAPEIVFHWKDRLTEAEGWTVINSLRNGAAGGGTRMRLGLEMNEVLSLAKTMEIKFSVAGPPIGGAKSGINFDPEDPRKEGVLKRWYEAVLPLLHHYYGTGGDLNIDEVREVLPITRKLGLLHCQEGVVNGHFSSTRAGKAKRISRLQEGVSKVVTDPLYSPDPSGKFTVADLITGWGVAEAARLYYKIWGLPYKGKRVIVQGFGNVGGAAAYYLAQAGMTIVGVIDAKGGLLKQEGFSFEEIRKLLIDRDLREIISKDKLSFEETNKQIWDLNAEVFLPCARSRILSKSIVDRMISTGMELISPGANVPFEDSEIFMGPTSIYADSSITVVPDFIANCGMARAFAYFMEGEGELTDSAIFSDVSNTIENALLEIKKDGNPSNKSLWQRGLEIALDKLEV